MRLGPIALHRVPGRVERLDDRVGRDLAATNGVDPLPCPGKAGGDPRREVPGRDAERVEFARLGTDAARSPEEQEDAHRDEREEQERDRQQEVLRHAASR